MKRFQIRKLSFPVRVAIATAVVTATVWMRLALPLKYVPPFGLTIPIILVATLRSRRLLWASMIPLAGVNVLKQMLPHEMENAATFFGRGQWGGTIVTVINLFVVGAIADVWLRAQVRVESQNEELEIANAALKSREEEVALNNRELSAQKQRFETVLWTMPFAVAVADASCADVRLNPAGAMLFNTPADVNVAGQVGEWPIFFNGRPIAPESFPVIRACREGAEVVAEELEYLSVMGKRLVLLANARSIRDPEGKLMGAVAAFVDITPQKELQREIDLRRREAEEASVHKTRFLAAVSHDIRTPANAISLLAELIRRTSANPAMAAEIPELAAELQATARSLVTLLGDVLDLARFDSGRVELQETEFLLAMLIADECRQMLPMAREKGLELSWSAPEQAIHVRIDRIKLARILGNLLGNAIKFTETGYVRIEALEPGEWGARIRVSDSGIGIPEEFQGHIFDEFFQLRNPERDRGKGIGLGLTICKRLVDAMGGTIEVESRAGAGSTFTVTLPPDCVLQAPALKTGS